MSADARWPWSVLGLARMPADPAEVRRAYARALKKIDQSNDIEGFAALRAAYEHARGMREANSQKAAAKKARKAAAAPVEAPVAAPSPETYASQFVLYPKTPPAPEPAPSDAAGFASLLQNLTTSNPSQTLKQRVIAALDSPFMADPAFAPRIRAAIAGILVKGQVMQTNGTLALNAAITPALLARLDQEFGWLSDYTAFRGVFWQQKDLQHLLQERHADGVLPKATKPAPPRGRLRRAFAWSADHFTLCIFGLLFALMVLSAVEEAFPGNPLFLWLSLALLALVPLGILRFFGVVAFTLWSRVYHPHTAGLMTAITFLWFGLIFADYGLDISYQFVAAGGLMGVLIGFGRLIGPKRSAALESRLQHLTARLTLLGAIGQTDPPKRKTAPRGAAFKPSARSGLT
jgi:hypothetical protein